MEGDIQQALAAVEDGLRVLLGANLWTSTDAESRATLADLTRLEAVLDAVRLQAVADLDSRPDAVPGTRAGTGAQTFMTSALRMSPQRASRDVKAARAELPQMKAALARGDVHRDHLDVAVRTLNRIPAKLWRPKAALADEVMTGHALEFSPDVTTGLAREVQRRLDPDGADTFDPDAETRRGLWLGEGADGMLLLRGQFAGTDKALIQSVLAALSKPDPLVKDEQGTLMPDTRTRPQRLADAMVEAFRRAAEPAKAETVIITTFSGDATDATTGAPVDGATLREAMCDALFRTVKLSGTGAVLDMGRRVRLATANQRVALTARDRGCVFPGCGMHAAACHAHHVIGWEHGGRTDIGNLALLCGRHHRMLHQGHWSLKMLDGVPWVIPPAALDPRQRPRKNRIHEARQRIRQLAIDDPPADAPPAAA